MISEDKALEKAIELHPEMQGWGPKEFRRAEIQEGVNWNLHLQMDAIVLRRASDDSLPDAAVIGKLRQSGVSFVEAVHRIARLVAEDLWERVKGPSKKAGKQVSEEDWAAEMNRIVDQKIRQLVEP